MRTASTERAETPAVSVVIPVYNAELYLRDSLDSVLNGAFLDLEVVCADDGSTDRSLGILRGYEKADPRVRVLALPHRSAGEARNAGMRAAQGKYVHFLDADDRVAPRAYERLVKTAEATGADVCECLYTNVRAGTGAIVSKPCYKGSWMRVFPWAVSLDRDEISLIFGHVVPWNKLYRRDFLIEEGIAFDDMPCAEDRAFYYDVLFRMKKTVRIPDRLVEHRIGIATSLDGSDVRFAHFDVEFRSFEHIWRAARNEPESRKRRLLDACMQDSFVYFWKASGTAYEREIAEKLAAYWQPYVPMLGRESFQSDWIQSFLNGPRDSLPRAYGELLQSLEAVCRSLPLSVRLKRQLTRIARAAARRARRLPGLFRAGLR